MSYFHATLFSRFGEAVPAYLSYLPYLPYLPTLLTYLTYLTYLLFLLFLLCPYLRRTILDDQTTVRVQQRMQIKMGAYRSADCAQDNEEAMCEAIKLLRAGGIDFYRPDEWTLKFDDWNYWPRTQRLHRDGDKASRRNQGLSELKSLIESMRTPTRPRTATKSTPEKPTPAATVTLRLLDE